MKFFQSQHESEQDYALYLRTRDEEARAKLKSVRVALATRLLDMLTEPGVECTIPSTLPDAILRGDALNVRLRDQHPEIDACFSQVCVDLNVSAQQAEAFDLVIFPLWGSQ